MILIYNLDRNLVYGNKRFTVEVQVFWYQDQHKASIRAGLGFKEWNMLSIW